MLFELSRIVLWWRDAASLDAPPPRREIEEIALTWLFIATLAVWANDATPGQERTRRFLRRRLADADALAQLCGSPPAESRPVGDPPSTRQGALSGIDRLLTRSV